MIKKTIVIFILFLICNISYSQKKIELKGVRGKCTLIDNITPEHAKAKAIEDAKSKALLEAGIPESIISTNIQLISVNNEITNRYFQSIGSNEVYGNVVLNSEPIFSKNINEFHNIIYEVIVDVIVYKYDKLGDPSFTFKTNGIQKFYKNNDKLNFEVKPYKDGYFRLFLIDIDMDTCFSIFPNDFEKDKLFKEDVTVFFPNVNYMDYTLESKREKEVNHLLVVFLKQKITPPPFSNINNLLRWIYAINPSDRKVEYYTIQFEN